MVAMIFFWIFLVLFALSTGVPDTWKGKPYAATAFLVIALVLLGLKVFGSPLG